ncbi:ACP S-malonyltransferase [Brevibacillus laterosporus]|uniref:[acyl-carrier-protein] S-malonyltransferase n=2 Tax=Brevibacillus laterosporus TaxID=1465 RepID=A0AAP3G5U4_BRELA|nr:ACP S-malonyltransferase [Brevibacillus laterosporus]MCR8978423.1 ACP S-malonyltransferase [Brevibacillus laterosporus]MCZ0805578.1 ACP S-malonyltransferase [Brevibacillus laterosporus]MCZ0825300.1 ACP S-malonyltransferase [Brevibacillus laterosporus]MCZ0849076.1 ACP S-malonyltransferase [Brevibacillus laterosporus]
MDKPIVFMFSGQGSQYFQMGKELFDQNPSFRRWMLQLDRSFTSITGQSVLDILYDPRKTKGDIFNHTIHTHPAIFMLEYALAQTLIESGIRPTYVLGSSLGEFAAAAVAGILDAEQALAAVLKQAEAFESNCVGGGMLAVLAEPAVYENSILLKNETELVGVNYHSHFVISGGRVQIQAAERFLKEHTIIFQQLPVSFAFHSSLIDPAEQEYKAFLSTQRQMRPTISFVSGVKGRLINELDSDYFWDVVRQPIRFYEAMKAMEQERDYIYLDISPSGVLSNFAKRIIPSDSHSECYAILSSYGVHVEVMDRLQRAGKGKNMLSKGRKEKKMTTFLFPGQGSQHKGMGETLFDEFAEVTAKADEILGYSIKELCLEDPKKQLGSTDFTQPALYIVNALIYLKKVKDTGKQPDFVAGHSLGEYNALFAAGAFDFETGLRIVKKRGELMAKATGGGMAAVMGLSEEQIDVVLKQNGLTSIDVANYNSPSQIVLSGRKEEIIQAQSVFEAAGAVMYIILNVSGAFHSRYMEQAKQEFGDFLEQFSFGSLTIPVISNVTARPYKQCDIKPNVMEQITSSVKWTETIRYLMGKGEMEFEEIGPKDVLKKLLNTIRRDATPLEIDEEDEQPGNVDDVQTVVTSIQSELQPKNHPISSMGEVTASSIGSQEFKHDYGLKYAYVVGAMYKGISSKELVVKVGKAGMLGFFGSGGVSMDNIEKAIQYIQRELKANEAYGMNFLHHPDKPDLEEKTIDLYLKYGITVIEASSFMSLTPALVRYRAKGLSLGIDKTITIRNKIIAKVSRPEVAAAFLRPAPERIIEKLLQERKITFEEAECLRKIPMADDLCVEADSGGHTDQGSAYALMPAMIKLRDEMMKQHGYSKKIRVGAAGGIGTPEAAVAAFMLGADFIVTGSINQCTVEAGTSDAAKELLQQANVQDMDYAPAGDMFEIGAKVQVLKKGLFFPSRANKLYDLYRQYNSLDEIDEATKKRIQEKYFKKSFEEVYKEVIAYKTPQELEKIERNPKNKMAAVFKWYFAFSNRLAISGSPEQKVDYQIHCGPALGAFNQWVQGTALENWKDRHVDEIGEMLMKETAELLKKRIMSFIGNR